MMVKLQADRVLGGGPTAAPGGPLNAIFEGIRGDGMAYDTLSIEIPEEAIQTLQGLISDYRQHTKQ